MKKAVKIKSEQSFDVTLDVWEEVTFVSCRPPSWQYEDTSFFLVGDEQILYKFPNSTKGDVELFDSVGAVAFRDINDDGKNSIWFFRDTRQGFL